MLRLDAATEQLIEIPATCWKIAAGHVSATPIVGGHLELREIFLPQGGDLPCAVDGTEDPYWTQGTLDAIAEIVMRMTPHATWYFAPSFFGCEAYGQPWSGLAHLLTDVAFVRTDRDARATLSTTLHEAWHIVEGLLTRQERAIVDAAVLRGGLWVEPYYDSPFERRARAFQHWSMHRYEAPPDATRSRLRTAIRRWALDPHERVFHDVYTGRVGQRAATRRWVAEHRLPAAVVERAEAERAAAARPVADRVADAIIAAGAAFDRATSLRSREVTPCSPR